MRTHVRGILFSAILAGTLAFAPAAALADDEVSAVDATQDVESSIVTTNEQSVEDSSVASDENDADASVTTQVEEDTSTDESLSPTDTKTQSEDANAGGSDTTTATESLTEDDAASTADSTASTESIVDADAVSFSDSTASTESIAGGDAASTATISTDATTSVTSAAPEATDTTVATEAVDDEATMPAMNVYRLYNPYTGEHFFTADLNEAKGLVGYGWTWEGVGWVAPTNTGSEVYRLYNPYNGEHLYTTSNDEATYLASIGWRREGVAWLSSGSKSVLREFNPYEQVGTHNYSTSSEEYEYLGSIGWKREGVAWYSLNREPEEVEPFWATGPSGRWWVQRNGSYAAGRLVTPTEDGNPGIYAYATSGNGHVVRGSETVGNKTIVADANTGELPSATGWWESSAPTGASHKYFIERGSDNIPYAKTGRFVDGDSAYYGIPGSGYILVGRYKIGNAFILTDSSGKLFESTGFVRFQAADDSSAYLYRMGNYCSNGQIGARADGFFNDTDGKFYADSSSGRVYTSGVFYADGGWWRAVDWGGCFSAGSWQDMAAKAQNYRSSTTYLILVDCTRNRFAVYQWDNGWYAVHEWICSTGANGCTVRGEFTTKLKGYSFGRGYTCYYFTQFYGDYLIHSVKYYPGTMRIMDGRLGVNVSHGCVRLEINNAKWVYDNIPRSTKVVTY